MTESRSNRIQLGFQAKVLLIYTAAVLAMVFLAFVAGSYYINRLQRANVADAVQLAQEQATEVARRISEVLAKRPLSGVPEDQVQNEISGLLEFNLRLNRTVTWVGYFDAAGNCVVERNSLGETIVRLPENSGEPRDIDLPTGVPGQMAQVTVRRRSGTRTVMDEHEVRQEISRDGRPIGEIRMKVAESPIYQRMATASESISSMLLTGVLILLALFVAVYWVVQKVTAKQMQLVRQAERMDRMAYVGTLASGLAHEIRNPLSAMTVNLDVLREELEEVLQPTVALAATGTSDALPSTHLDDTKLQAIQRIGDLVTRVRREIQGLNTTLSHFLDFALPSKEGMTEFPLRGLMEEIIELHREQCRQKEITIEISGAPASQTIIEADRRLCHQALRNIIINAIQVLEGCVPRQIRIRVNPAGSVVRLTISDTGQGIDPEKLDSIFEAFVSGRKGGTGLGLALTRKIVEEHHGRITASNNPDGPGAVFTVELPIRQPLSS